MKSIYIIPALIISLLFINCSSPSFGDDEQVLLPINKNESVCQWRIVYGSDFGKENQFNTDNISYIELELGKNTPSYVLAYPLDQHNVETGKPYGAIPPYSKEICQIDGFAANILRELYCNEQQNDTLDNNIKLFNWQKFMDLCREYENPWLINQARIITAIKKGKFKKSDIKIDGKKK